MIRGVQQALKADGVEVSMSQFCRWFDVPRRTVYFRSCKALPKVRERFEKPIKDMIDLDPSYGSHPLEPKGWVVEFQPEPGAAHLPDSGLAGQAKSHWI